MSKITSRSYLSRKQIIGLHAGTWFIALAMIAVVLPFSATHVRPNGYAHTRHTPAHIHPYTTQTTRSLAGNAQNEIVDMGAG